MKISKGIVRLGLTILSIAGVGVTGVAAAKCHENAIKKETKKEKLKAYAPAIASGAVTALCIVSSHRISSREIAALSATASYAIANRNKLEEKIKPYLTEQEAKEIKQEVTKVSVPRGPSIEWTGCGTMKFIEAYSGRMFYSSMENVLAAETKLSNRFSDGEYVSYNTFYELLGLVQTKFGDEFGWIPDEDYYDYKDPNPIGFTHDIVKDDDGLPLCIINITIYPKEGYYEI